MLRFLAMHVFRLGMGAFPPSIRRAFGEDALATFDRELAMRRRRGPLAAIAFVAVAFIDAVKAGIGERRRLRQRDRDRLVLSRGRRERTVVMRLSWIDVKLGIRMLMRYPGLTAASGLALAFAIGVGAAWFDVSGDFLRPRLPLPGGDRIVEIEMRNAVASEEERRVLHDFLEWRRDLRSIEALSAYRAVDRNLLLGSATPQPLTLVEMTASAFRLTDVPPLAGRWLVDADEHPNASPVMVLGYTLWQQRFGGRGDVIGTTVHIGRTPVTVVGVMPEGYAFPVNHQAWMPLRLPAAGVGPLEGPPVRIVGRVAAEATQAQANVEVSTLVDRVRGVSPRTHEHLRPRVLAYGGESPGDLGVQELIIRHLPVLLVLLVACANVATLIYARTATREGEIATRYALGASRGRIVGQLFVEALVLASIAAVVGLLVANAALHWGMATYYSGGTMPFWVRPGLKPSTIAFAIVLTIVGAAVLGILPALKATRRSVQSELRNLGSGGSTLKFGPVWTAAMIAQVALTVVCLPPATGISQEVIRDRRIRSAFPAERCLAVQLALDDDSGRNDTAAVKAHADRLTRTYQEFERRVLGEAGVQAVVLGDRLPGMWPAVRSAELETTGGEAPVLLNSIWRTDIGPGYFEAFGSTIVAGRDFSDSDRSPQARTVLVNEAFRRRFLGGASPVGKRLRYLSPQASSPEPWFEIVGVVRDIGMTPTDLGEAPYVYRAVSAATAYPLVLGVQVTGDLTALAQRVRTIAADVDPDLRVVDARSLDDLVWRVDVPNVVGAGAIITVVALGLFLSAAGIFALMSVSVARRTREIGLRTALGATHARLMAEVFSRALVLVGSGVAAGNLLLTIFIAFEPEVTLRDVWQALLATSLVMLTVGAVACLEPARRALRIQPTDALKQS